MAELASDVLCHSLLSGQFSKTLRVADLYVSLHIVTKSGNRFCYPFLSLMFNSEFQTKTQLQPLVNVGHLSSTVLL